MKYLDIVKYLKNPLLDTYLSFVKSTADIFTTNFTVLMQRDEPLIHILHFQLKKIINLLLLIIVKPEAIDQTPPVEYINVDKTLEDKENVLELKSIAYLETVKDTINNLAEADKLRFLFEVKKFVITSTKYIIDKTKNLSLHLFGYVSPKKIRVSKCKKYSENCKIVAS